MHFCQLILYLNELEFWRQFIWDTVYAATMWLMWQHSTRQLNHIGVLQWQQHQCHWYMQYSAQTWHIRSERDLHKYAHAWHSSPVNKGWGPQSDFSVVNNAGRVLCPSIICTTNNDVYNCWSWSEKTSTARHSWQHDMWLYQHHHPHHTRQQHHCDSVKSHYISRWTWPRFQHLSSHMPWRQDTWAAEQIQDLEEGSSGKDGSLLLGPGAKPR